MGFVLRRVASIVRFLGEMVCGGGRDFPARMWLVLLGLADFWKFLGLTSQGRRDWGQD